jgi:hypothetical protein
VSSTKRGGERSEADNYPTPHWCLHRLLDAMPELREGGNWLEPAAGAGDLITAAEIFKPKEGVLYQSPTWTACELREEAKGELLCFPKSLVKHIVCPQDFFEWKTKAKFDAILTNPPFWLAQDFIEKSLTMKARFVIMLLRLNYVGSEKRSKFFRENMAHRIYVLPNRPPFTKNKHGKWATDSIEYAWFVWDTWAPPTSKGHLEMLDLTPKADRRPGQ